MHHFALDQILSVNQSNTSILVVILYLTIVLAFDKKIRKKKLVQSSSQCVKLSTFATDPRVLHFADPFQNQNRAFGLNHRFGQGVVQTVSKR